MADFAYTIGIDVDSSGIDAFIAKVRGLATSVNFGSSFQVPSGVSAAGPGIVGQAANLNPSQTAQFAQALQAQSLAALTSQRQQGLISAGELASARTQILGITGALIEGARRFESIMGRATGQTASGLIVPQSVLDQTRDDAVTQATVARDRALTDFDAKQANAERQRQIVTDKDIREIKEKERDALRRRLALTGQQSALDTEIARTKAEILLAEQRQARLEREQNQEVFRRARDEGFFNVGTRTQRIQAAMHSRDGRLADPLNERRLGSLIGQRVFQASSFAVGGLAFYGALQVIRDTLQETEKLEREFFVVRGQIERTFGSESEDIFNRFKERVREISLTTGQLGSEIAFVLRQLSAAFVDSQPLEDETEEQFRNRQRQQFELAGRNAEQAFKFAEVTGLDSKEITDSLTALGLSFPELKGNFTDVLDDAVALEEQFGVLGGQIITFAADLAPLASNLGFTAEELTELGAVAQKFSGRGGGQLAEQFGRILTDLPTKAPELLRIFSQTPQLADLSRGLADAFVADNMRDVLEFILQAAQRVRAEGLDPGLTQQISEAVAGRREGASFAAILRQPNELLKALQGTNDRSAGAVDRRWQEVRDSLTETMDRLKRAVEQFAEALLSAGLADAFKLVAGALTIVATAAGAVVRLFDRLNDLTGGLAGTMAGLYLSLKSVDLIMKSLATSGVLKMLAPGVAGRFGQGVAAGGASGLLGNLGGVLGTAAGSAAGTVAAAGGLRAFVAQAVRQQMASLGARAAGYATGGSLLQFAGRGAAVGGLVAPTIAVASVIEMRNAVNDLRDSVRAQGDNLRIQAQSADWSGLFAGLAAADTDTRFLGIPGTQKLGRRIIREDLPEDIMRDVAQSRLEAVDPLEMRDALATIDREDLGILGAKYDDVVGEVEKAIAGDADADIESVAEFLRTIGEHNATMGQAMARSLEKNLRVREAAEEVNSGAAAADFQQMLSALQAGRTTPEELESAANQATAPLQVLAEAALEAGDYTTYLAQMESIAQIRDAASQAVSQAIAASISFSEDVRAIFGDATPETRIAAATRILRNPRVTDKATRLKALQDLQQARADAHQEWVDQARTERERLDRMAQGVGVDPLAQAEAIYQQIQAEIDRRLAELRSRAARGTPVTANPFDQRRAGTTVFAAEIDSLEGITRDEIDSISDQLVEDIREYGEGAIRIRLALLRAREAELKAAYMAAGNVAGVDTSALATALAEVQKQIEIYEALETSGIDPSGIVTDDGKPTPTEQAEIDRRRREDERDRKLAIINRDRARAAGDPVREAALAQRAAQVSLAYAREEFGADSIEAINAEADLISARHQARSAAKELALAQIAVQQAQVAGDPVAEAQLAIRAAKTARAYATGPVEALQAQAQLITALQQQQAAYDDIAVAQLDLVAAQAAGNPVEVARIGLQQADLAVSQAKGTAERLRAEAQRIQAQDTLAEAIRDITESQLDLAIAIADAGGDAITASERRIEQIQNRLNVAISEGDEAGVNRMRAELVAAQRSKYDAVLEKQRGDVDFALQMDQITTQQAIQAYQALLSIPTNTEAQNRELMLAIKNLRDQAGQDFQFNLPTQLGLPTVYEVARFSQGEGGYNDNRTISVVVNTSSTSSAQEIADAVVAAVGEPNRSGITPRRY